MNTQHNAEMERALELVGKIYEAAAETERWPDFLGSLADAMHSRGTIIWSHDTADTSARFEERDAAFFSNVRFEPGYLQSYAEYYTHKNVLLAGLQAMPEGAVMLSSSVLPDAEFKRSEYYNDWLKPQGIGLVMGGPVLKRGSKVAMISTLRLACDGTFAEQDMRLMQLLMPHLRRGCLLHQRLVRIQAERSGALATLELLPTAVWLLDEAGKVQFANKCGRELDGRCDGVWIGHDGRPDAADLAERHALRRIVMATVAVARGKGIDSECALRIRRKRDDSPLHVMLYPLAGSAFAGSATAAMFIFDPSRAAVADASVLRSLYGLTPAEAQLSTQLARGLSVQEYCAAHEISQNTARSHLKHSLAKTGTHRQAQLVSLVHRLSAMRPAQAADSRA
jgi:DNA-binding CsgD family transcriptional regulator